MTFKRKRHANPVLKDEVCACPFGSEVFSDLLHQEYEENCDDGNASNHGFHEVKYDPTMVQNVSFAKFASVRPIPSTPLPYASKVATEPPEGTLA
jgi:hypothetical protein